MVKWSHHPWERCWSCFYHKKKNGLLFIKRNHWYITEQLPCCFSLLSAIERNIVGQRGSITCRMLNILFRGGAERSLCPREGFGALQSGKPRSPQTHQGWYNGGIQRGTSGHVAISPVVRWNSPSGLSTLCRKQTAPLSKRGGGAEEATNVISFSFIYFWGVEVGRWVAQRGQERNRKEHFFQIRHKNVCHLRLQDELGFAKKKFFFQLGVGVSPLHTRAKCPLPGAGVECKLSV